MNQKIWLGEHRNHKYELTELGELTEAQKLETCWKSGSISGSKMPRLFKEYDKVVKEDLGIIEKYDLHADPVIDEKLRRGTDAEEFIRQQAEKEWDIQILTDKSTYTLRDTLYYANIDGFSPDGELIYEIKNTETDDMDAIVERYKWQGVYYCWFFGRKSVEFIALIKGYKLRRRRYTPTQEDYQELQERAKHYIASIVLNEPEAIEQPDEDGATVYQIDDELTENKLEQLVKIQEKIKELEACEKELKSYFAEALNKQGTAYESKKTGYKVSLIKSNRVGAIDKDKLMSLYPTLEIPTKPDYTTTTVKITKPKQ